MLKMEAVCTYEAVDGYSRSTGRRIIEVWNVHGYESRKFKLRTKSMFAGRHVRFLFFIEAIPLCCQ